ncbi:MAG TPA: oligosaccharide flippase family protein [Gaiellaceae bacterium]|nr:oligosaccharide flippase family protein [Gaiellaceae bacterium]
MTSSPDVFDGRRSFVAVAGLTYGTNLAVAVLSLANVVITARVLGPSGRGDVALMTTIAMLTASLAAFGIHEANANIGAAEPERRRSLATNSVLLALALGLTAAGVLAGLVQVFPALDGDTSTPVLALALAAIPILILQAGLQMLIQSQYRFAVTNAAWLLGPVTNVSVNGLFAAIGVLTVSSAVAVWVAGQLLGTILLVWYAARRAAGFGAPDAGLARRSLAFGSQTHLGRVMTMGNYRLDQWFVGSIAGTRELGLYSVAVAWAEALFYLPTALQMVQRPRLVRAAPREAGAWAATVFRAATLLTGVLAIGLVVAAPVLCVGVFGDEFRGSIDDLRILAAGGFGIVALKLFGSALNAQGKPMLTNVGIGVAFTATIALDLLLIPAYGGLGAAIASTLAYSAGGVAMALVFSRALGVRRADLVPRGTELRPVFGALRARAQRGAAP